VFSTRLPSSLATNRLTEAIARRRATAKPFIDLTLSNPTRAGFEYPRALLTPLADQRGLLYTPSAFGAIEARRAVAGEFGRHGVEVSPERIVLTASSSDGYSMLFKALADAGDEVLIPRPSYPLFEHLTRLDSLMPKPYSLEYHGRWSIDFPSVERALSPRTRAILVVSPNNPTGSYVRRDEFDRLVALARSRDLAIIADEVFADYELEPGSASAAARAAAPSPALTFAIGGLSKSAGLPQVKLGWIAAGGPPLLVAAALERLEHVADTYLSVSTPIQQAAPELLRAAAPVRAQIADRVRQNYQQLKTDTAAVPSCTALPSEGGWYAILQVPTLEPEEDLALRLLDAGVLAHPGYFFDFTRESFLIVSLLAERDAFRDGLSRILRHFACNVPADQHV